jgi:hypothetical protein
MAKIFRTEELQINGDNISIVSSDSNKFQIKGKDETVFLDENDVSSLHYKRNHDVSSLAASQSSAGGTATTDVSSLSFKEIEDVSSLQALRNADVSDLETDVSSLQALRNADVSDLETDVSSLQALRNNDVSSLSFNIASNDVIVASQKIWNDGEDAATSVAVDLGRDFGATAPKVVGILKSTVASDPILGVMLSAVSGGNGSNHTATFVFSDDISSENYTIEVLGSI